MNATVNNLLLAGDTFIQETHRDCGPFTKDKERIKKIKETGDWKYVYENHLMLLKIQNMMGINIYLLQRFNFLIKKTSGWTAENEIISGKESAEELHKLIIRKLNKKRTLNYYRHYVGRSSGRYGINK